MSRRGGFAVGGCGWCCCRGLGKLLLQLLDAVFKSLGVGQRRVPADGSATMAKLQGESQVTQFVYAFIVTGSTALAHGLLAAALDLTPPAKSAHNIGPISAAVHCTCGSGRLDRIHATQLDAARAYLAPAARLAGECALLGGLCRRHGGLLAPRKYDGLRRRYLLKIVQKKKEPCAWLANNWGPKLKHCPASHAI